MSTEQREKRVRAGRPLKFTNLEDMQAKIQAYFKSCEEQWVEKIDYVEQLDAKKKRIVIDGRVQYDVVTKMELQPAKTPTITGLAYALDTSRDVLLNYENEEHEEDIPPEFPNTIKKAKDFIHDYTEGLLSSGKVAPVGIIFSLKNNYAWRDANDLNLGNQEGSEGFILNVTSANAKRTEPGTDGQAN